jgi:CheY-like chemotaxis protein
MTRFERTPTPFINTAVGVSLPVIFLADLYIPLGIAVWVFYLLPIVLSYLMWRPMVPPLIAGAVIVLTVGGFFLSPPLADPAVALTNRVFGIGCALALSWLGYQFIRNKLEVRKQEWLQSGQTVLSENMAGDQTLSVLGDKVLRVLAEYTDAQAGVIFIEDGGVFRRFATYGVPEGASISEHVKAGDGLLGQAIKDNRLMVIDEVPPDYLIVGSALGRSTSRHLAIAPVAVDGQVNSVLELGSFRPIGEAEKELLTRVSESIAIAVRSAHYRTKLQILLEETQRQAEELQMQTEELRVTNEELEQQSRALQESQARLEQQQAELEQTNAQLEEQAQILETQKDELVQARNNLEAHARDLRQASRYKSEFLANMSHELRTPLNASLILARLLADNDQGNLTPDQVKQARTIETSGNDLLALINDVLDLSKVEAGHMDLYPQSVSLPRLTEHLRGMFQALAEQKGLQLHLRIAADAPEALETDSKRLEQILKNLLSNAIKFTEQGEVALDIRPALGQRLAFIVRDTGIGIAEDQHHIVFEPFCQADGTTNRKYGGTGLGLSISRELVRILGGEIELTSRVGEGSTFTVLLPEIYDPALVKARAAEPGLLRVAPPPMRSSPPPKTTQDRGSAVAGARMNDDRAILVGSQRVILIVDDDEPFTRILYDLAHELQFQALIATSSDEALALCAQYSPSAVLLDIGLPDHSGLSVLDRLKMDARTRHIPVHVVSSHDYAEAALALGAVGYMLKPVKREQLIEAFQRLETRLLQKVRRVLIVEDDEAQRDSLRQLLGSRDVETVGAASAAECLDHLSRITFDCMVLDLSLPDASGFALLDRLSSEDRYQFPPVIVYTGKDLSQEEEQRLRRYSKSVIIKGAKSPERLLDEVTLFLHQVVADLPATQQAMIQKSQKRNALLDGRHILIVEDDVRNVFALTSILEPQGVKIQIARNGVEALGALTHSLDGGPPVDLVLMDIMMPEMDGLTAMREIRKRPDWRKLPIIALTAKAMKNDHEESLAAGANDYMAKPLDVDKLLSLVRVWMPR